MDMTVEALTQYLKQAAELEASVYRQKEAVKQARMQLVKRNIEKKKVTLTPPKDLSGEIEKPISPDNDINSVSATLGLWVFVCVVAAVLLGIGIATKWTTGIVLGVLLMVVGFAMVAMYGKKRMGEDEHYAQAQKEYEEKVAAAKAEHQKALAQYHTSIEKLRKQYEDEYRQGLARANRNFDAGLRVIEDMETVLEETKALLVRLYKADILFEKYRDLVSVCTIYEYFVSGRCTELAGPNGAYNLYEAELRQNIIITRLDTIIDQLEQIKAGQYMLYSQLETTNAILADVSHDMKAVVNSTRDIAHTNRITAIYAGITAENSEIQKYLTVMNM